MFESLAKLAEEIGNEMHDKAGDPQEDASDATGERIAEAIRAVEPKWTTEPPTRPGYYWVHFVDEFPQPIIAFFMKDDSGKWYADIDDEKYDLRAFTHWIGPLPVPEPPK